MLASNVTGISRFDDGQIAHNLESDGLIFTDFAFNIQAFDAGGREGNELVIIFSTAQNRCTQGTIAEFVIGDEGASIDSDTTNLRGVRVGKSTMKSPPTWLVVPTTVTG
jgi:hypothetical protein